MNYVKGWGFANIVDIPLVSNAQDVDAGAFYSHSTIVQRVLDLLDDEMRHLPIDIAGKFDETGLDTRLSGFPGEIERINRNTVASQPGAGIKGHEAEGLGRRCVDHFPDVDSHAIAHHRQLIHQADID